MSINSSAKMSPIQNMRLLHTMIRVTDLEQTIEFYTKFLDMKLLRKKDYPDGEYTLAFLGYGDEASNTVLELTFNWAPSQYEIGSGFGHIAIAVKDIYQVCHFLQQRGVKVIRKPGSMKEDPSEIIAFITDPDGYQIELIEKT